MGPVPHHDGQAQRSEKIHNWGDAGLIPHAFHESLKVAFAVFVEAFIKLLFLRQALHNANRSQGFLGKGSEQSCAHAGLAVGLFDAPLIAENHPQHSRGDRQRGKSKLPIEPEHQSGHAHKH